MINDANLMGLELQTAAGPVPGLRALQQKNPFVRADSVELISRQTEAGTIEIRALMEHAGEDLVARRYASRGYRMSRSADVTLGAYWEGRLVSTLGLRRDNGRLAADQSFPDAMTGMRERGWQLCEFTRLAADPEGPSKLVLASLFHLAYLHAARHWGAEFLVIEVNPRHEAFYRRTLGFEPHGDQRMHRTVGAPAVLMSLCFKMGQPNLKRLGGTLHDEGRSRSLFPYFFNAADEPRMLERLADVYGYDA